MQPGPRSSKDPELEEAVRALRQGCEVERSFRLVFERFQGPLEKFFARRRASPEECRDLVQETFLRVHRSIGSFRGESRLGTWIFSIAINIHRRELRRRKIAELPIDDPESNLADFLDAGAASPIEAMQTEEERQQLWALIDQLPPQMQRCLVLKVRHQLEVREIANLLGLAFNTVKVHLHSARSRLRQLATISVPPRFSSGSAHGREMPWRVPSSGSR